jgi:tetratricopeptide (TPR) repeat protein
MRSIDLCGIGISKLSRSVIAAAILGAAFSLAGCATMRESLKGLEDETKPDEFARAKAFLTEGNYEAAFKENQRILAEGNGAPDVALFNMGLIWASLNPKKDYPRALTSFKTLVNQHPHSAFAEQSKIWIQVLEEHQKLANEKQKLIDERQKLVDDRQKLVEEKRTSTREREALSQEREKLKYTLEKSRQLDMQIEKRRRQTQSR